MAFFDDSTTSLNDADASEVESTDDDCDDDISAAHGHNVTFDNNDILKKQTTQNIVQARVMKLAVCHARVVALRDPSSGSVSCCSINCFSTRDSNVVRRDSILARNASSTTKPNSL